MAKWYMTVGVGGGEYASTDEGFLRNEAETLAIDLKQDIVSRPCPPDLAEWLDAETHSFSEVNGRVCAREKVPGGWLYVSVAEDYESDGFGSERRTKISQVGVASTFVPVAGAAGITILETPDETV